MNPKRRAKDIKVGQVWQITMGDIVLVTNKTSYGFFTCLILQQVGWDLPRNELPWPIFDKRII